MKLRKAKRIDEFYLSDIQARKELDLLKDEVQMLIQERFLSIANFASQKNLTKNQYTRYRQLLCKTMNVTKTTHNHLMRIKQDVLKYPVSKYYPKHFVIRKIRDMIKHINYYSKDNLYMMKFGHTDVNLYSKSYTFNKRVENILNEIEKSLKEKNLKGIYVFDIKVNCNLYFYRDLILLLEKDDLMKKELNKVMSKSRKVYTKRV